MKATAVSLLAIFEPKMQLEVPLFLRQYVWNRDDRVRVRHGRRRAAERRRRRSSHAVMPVLVSSRLMPPAYSELDITPALATATHPTCDFESVLRKQRDHAREAGDDRLAQAWHSLMCIASYHLQPGDPRAPLVSAGYLGTLRFPAPEDLTDEELDGLASFCPSVADPDLRARLCDVLWIRRRDHAAARLGVAAYVESAKRLHTPGIRWPMCRDRLERALNLAKSLGRRGSEYEHAVDALYAILDASTWPDFPHLPEALSLLLLDHKEADPKKEALRMADHACRAETAGDLRVARHHRWVESRWHLKSGDENAANGAALRVVDLHEREADAVHGRPFQEVHHLERAIEACRRVAGQKARVEALTRKLHEAQTRLVGQMRRVEVPLDMSAVVEQARAAVAGKGFLDAVIALARMIEPTSVSYLRALVEQGMGQHPLMYLIQTTVHDKRGRRVAKLPSVPFDGDDGGDAVLMRMQQHATHVQDAMAAAIIEPARYQILSEHPSGSRAFTFVVANSRFVPDGREPFFVRGLLAGLEGDFMEATHLLVPQVENSIREIFDIAGVLPAKRAPDGTQREKDLNDLLGDPHADEILGEDLAFTLRGLLIRATGSNLRHRLAHGLIDAPEFLADRHVYFWGLVLRLVVASALPPPEPTHETDPADQRREGSTEAGASTQSIDRAPEPDMQVASAPTPAAPVDPEDAPHKAH